MKKVFLYCISLYISFFRHLPGGRHGKSDQDQCERPVGGWVQRQARPLSLHPRSTVGTTPPWRRELRNKRTPIITSTVSSTSLLLSAILSSSERKRLIQAHSIWTYELNRSGTLDPANARLVGWSYLMSFRKVYTKVRLISVCLYEPSLQ